MTWRAGLCLCKWELKRKRFGIRAIWKIIEKRLKRVENINQARQILNLER
jgi:hypothetical protein